MGRGKVIYCRHFSVDSWLLGGGDLAKLHYGVKYADFVHRIAFF